MAQVHHHHHNTTHSSTQMAIKFISISHNEQKSGFYAENKQGYVPNHQIRRHQVEVEDNDATGTVQGEKLENPLLQNPPMPSAGDKKENKMESVPTSRLSKSMPSPEVGLPLYRRELARRLAALVIQSRKKSIPEPDRSHFKSYLIPNMSITDYLVRIAEYFRISEEAMIMAILHVCRLPSIVPISLDEFSEHRLVLCRSIVSLGFLLCFCVSPSLR